MILRIEIFLFLISILYSFYYLGDVLFCMYKNRVIKQENRVKKRQEIVKKQATQKKEKKSQKKEENSKILSSKDIETLRDTLKRVQVNKARGYYDTARNFIIEWLAIDKHNQEFNIELADVYELEENYKNAEYIYKDMLKMHPDSIEILKRLGNVRVLQWKLWSAAKPYEKAFSKKRDDIEIVDTLSEIYFELKNFKKCLVYTKLFLKDKPRDIEKLGMKWYCFEKESKFWLSIDCYKKILEIQPYNMEIKERIIQLEEK